MTLNNQEWIPAGSFNYHDLKLTRLAYVHNFGEQFPEEEREERWFAEEPIEADPEDMTEDEIKKRDDERTKKEQDESEEVQTLAKRKGYKMYIYGKNFRKANSLRVLFSFEDETATQIL